MTGPASSKETAPCTALQNTSIAGIGLLVWTTIEAPGHGWTSSAARRHPTADVPVPLLAGAAE
jgi:hypothetical protein